MALASGRVAAVETAKAECLRRWPMLMLKCEAVYYDYKLKGYVVTADDLSYGGHRTVGTGLSASEAWSNCLANLEDQLQ
jgi:hypothetical protein